LLEVVGFLSAREAVVDLSPGNAHRAKP
jgi:hypothetical protein